MSSSGALADSRDSLVAAATPHSLASQVFSPWSASPRTVPRLLSPIHAAFGGALSIDGAATLRRDGLTFESARARALFPLGTRWALEIAALHGGRPSQSVRSSSGATVVEAIEGPSPVVRSESRLMVSRSRWGGWVGFAGQRSEIRDQTWVPLIGIGGWSRARALTLSAAIGTARDIVERRTFEAVDSFMVARSELEQLTITTAQMGARWQGTTFEWEAETGLGVSPTSSPTRWARASALAWVGSKVGLVATIASEAPLVFGAGGSSSHRSTLGLRLAPWRTESTTAARPRGSAADVRWSLRAQRDGSHVIEVTAPGAETIEIMGDVTQWTPAALQRVGDDRWRVGLVIEPGVHHINLRVDGGAWMPPPGVPIVADEFNGSVGVIVVR